MADQPDSNGHRVTLAILGSKLDDIIHRLDRMECNFHEVEKRTALLELGQMERATQIKGICNDIAALEKKADSWSMLNSVGAFIAATLGAIGLSK